MINVLLSIMKNIGGMEEIILGWWREFRDGLWERA
jgi:hypothetical protein